MLQVSTLNLLQKRMESLTNTLNSRKVELDLFEEYLEKIESDVSRIEGTEEEMRAELLALANRIISDINVLG